MITKDTVVPQKRILPSCAKTKSICCFMNCTMTKKVIFNSVKVGASATYTKTPNKQNNLLDLNHYIVSGIWCIEFITATYQFSNNFISLRKKKARDKTRTTKCLWFDVDIHHWAVHVLCWQYLKKGKIHISIINIEIQGSTLCILKSNKTPILSNKKYTYKS